MKLRFFIQSSLLGILFFPIPLFSEDNIDEEIVVVASRTPTLASKVIGSVTSISQEDLNVQMIDGLEELVRYTPGVSSHSESQYGRSLTEDIHVRGIHGGVIFLIDGVRIADVYTGYGRDTVDTDLLKKVEILKGPSSVEYGSDGLAGTIAYFTKDPSDLASLNERYFSVGTSYQESNKQEKINLLTAYVGENTEGLLQLVNREIQETELHKGFNNTANPLRGDQKSFLAKFLVSATEKMNVSVVADFQEWEGSWDIKSDEGLIFFPTPPRSISQSTGLDEGSRERLSLKFDFVSDNLIYDLSSLVIYSQDTEQSQITRQQQVSFLNGIRAAPSPTLRIRDFDFNQSIEGFSFEAFKTVNKHKMVYGLDIDKTFTERPRALSEINLITGIRSNNVDGETYPNKTFPDSETKRRALFFNDRIELSDKQTLNLGFRYDQYKLDPKPDVLLNNANILNYTIKNIDDNALTTKVGYLYQINPELSVFGQYAEGFKAPDYESANIVFTNYAYRYTVIPNPDLDSEESESIEFGLRGKNVNSNWEINIFRNDIKGFIHAEVVGFSPQGLGVYQYRNADNAEVEGFEFTYRRDLNENISVQFSGSVTSGKEKHDGEGEHEEGEVDLVLLEMMSAPSRMLPLFECASSSSLPVWCGLSAKRSDRNATITGYHDETISFIDNIQEAINFGFEGIGIMHSSVDLIGDAIELIKANYDGLIMAYPDSGYFKSPNWQFEDVITPDHLTEFADQWKQAGANIIGGCCGLGPEHTEALCNLK